MPCSRQVDAPSARLSIIGCQPIDSHHETRLGGVASFVLVPHLTEPAPGFSGQQPEQSIGGCLFAGLLRSCSFGVVVGEGVAGVDLDDVVHERHRDCRGDVDRFAGERCQHEGGDAEVP